MASRSRGPVTGWRIAATEWVDKFDGQGAAMRRSRWNPPGQPAIYAAEGFALAMLEVLVQANGIPPPMSYVEIRIAESVEIEQVFPEDCPGWNADDFTSTHFYSQEWFRAARTAVLIVPSRVTCMGGVPRGNNLVINPRHPDFIAGKIWKEPSLPVTWDLRLFRAAVPS
jgi:RES domain-containing protein